MSEYDPTVPDRKPRLTGGQIQTAIAWLECNEAAGDEAGACQAVADWLKTELNQRAVRDAARRVGVSTGLAREALQRLASGAA